eukprot:4332443-Amphidinium_carterae.1
MLVIIEEQKALNTLTGSGGEVNWRACAKKHHVVALLASPSRESGAQTSWLLLIKSTILKTFVVCVVACKWSPRETGGTHAYFGPSYVPNSGYKAHLQT